MADNDESVSLTDTETESMIMSGVNAKSTPTISKVSLDDLFQLMKAQNNNLNAKFDEQSVKFNEKFDEVKNEIKRQNFNFDKQINEINARYENIQEQIVEAVSAVSYTHLDVYKRQLLRPCQL